MKKIRKRAMTLLEIMVVIFIIGIIGSVIGYNMKGSMGKGKDFKSRHAAEKIKEVLALEMDMKGMSPSAVIKNARTILKESGMIKDMKTIMQDGYGQPYRITYENDEIIVQSEHYSTKTGGKPE